MHSSSQHRNVPTDTRFKKSLYSEIQRDSPGGDRFSSRNLSTERVVETKVGSVTMATCSVT